MLICSAALLLPAVLRAEPATPPAVREFTGFGAATFGMRWEEVRRRYPDAREVPEGRDLGAPTVGGPFIHRLVLEKQPVEGLAKPTTVELRFWKKQLWGVVVYFGDNPDAEVIAMIDRRLGPSDGPDPNSPLWKRAHTQTTAELRQRWYGVNDLALSEKARGWFVLLMSGQWRGASPAELDEVEDRTPAPPTAPPR